MIKALQFISNEKQSFDENCLLVGDNDFLYLFIKLLALETIHMPVESVTLKRKRED